MAEPFPEKDWLRVLCSCLLSCELVCAPGERHLLHPVSVVAVLAAELALMHRHHWMDV